MARNEDAELVVRAEGARGARGAGRARQRGKLAVRHDLPARHAPHHFRARAMEDTVTVEVERDFRELDGLPGEERTQPRDDIRCEIVTIAFAFLS